MKKEIFIDQLFWFYQYKREYLKYSLTHTRLRLEHIDDGVAYFTEMRPSEEKMSELGDKVVDEIRQALTTLPSADIEAYLDVIQEFLNTVYHDLDVEYATTETDLITSGMPDSIPHIQNFIRDEYKSRLEKASKQPTNFDFFLTPDGKKALPKLKKLYHNAKPQDMAAGLWAMYELSLLNDSPLKFNQVELHSSLSIFGDIGTRQSLNSNINLLQADKYTSKINAEKLKIKGQKK